MSGLFKRVSGFLGLQSRLRGRGGGTRSQHASDGEFDISGEIARFASGPQRGDGAFEELLVKLAGTPPPDWVPHSTGPAMVIRHERLAELLSPFTTIRYLPRSSPSGFGPPELVGLSVHEFLEYLKLDAMELKVELTPAESTLSDGAVCKFLLVRQISRPRQPDEALSEALGVPAGWWLALDPSPILRRVMNNAG